MPIVDGLTSTKMIRSFEKSHPTRLQSTRTTLNGRIPIIAVSASLVEREHRAYVDSGFDGWILKPVAFARLSEIMLGIVESKARSDNVYRPGHWEIGGWFEHAQRDIFSAECGPNGQVPFSGPSKMTKLGAASDDPAVKGEDESRQSKEQLRLLADQEKKTDEVGNMT